MPLKWRKIICSRLCVIAVNRSDGEALGKPDRDFYTGGVGVNSPIIKIIPVIGSQF